MYTKILVPLDGSELSECVLPYVEWFTRVSDVNELIFLRIVEPFHIPGELETEIIPEERQHIEADAIGLAKHYLAKIAGRFQGDNYKTKSVVLTGKPASSIAEYVAKSDVDLIIMATHAFSGVRRWVRGSVADEVLRAARVPVLMVMEEDRPPDK